ncbi:copper homeostasis protein CutC [Paraburkholderia azotifigens]|uniref:PF03932 family protein CutC n=1 Tax=Paraburkholderia azotifigens TaxID=2057004 RepID=A0A5C6VRX5_9BURK|nr:copper homeostasis protein CutC [Paraburkholderia azotifigens]TXC87917.1 copper homeostasis protein CutC [Paraburkholderia azotifigens]
MRNERVLLEVIATTVDDAVAAARGGADRLELITAMGEGGLTPGIGMIEAVIAAVSIPVNVIVRPHSRSFVYDADDFAVILRDVRAARLAGAHAVVFGMLTASREVDREALLKVVDVADGMAVTFHRAFDEARDLCRALDVLLAVDGVTNVLTSGGKSSVLDAVEEVHALVAQAAGSKCTVLAGAGLTVNRCAEFVHATRVEAVHFGSGVRVDGAVAEDRVRRVRALLDA